MAGPLYIIVRLIPTGPTDTKPFSDALAGVAVTLYERSVTDPTGTTPTQKIGTASTLFEPGKSPLPAGPFNVIVVGASGLSATAIIDCTAFASAPYKEYGTSDLRVAVTRSGQTLGDSQLDYNVPWVPFPMGPATVVDWYDNLTASRYFEIPPASPGGASVAVPTDGTLPNFADLKNAITAVLAKDPATGVSDSVIAGLTLAQCKHIAYEITWDRNASPLPLPEVASAGTSLADMYKLGSGSKTDPNAPAREKFLGALAEFYAKGNAEADTLTKYVYAVAMAVGASLQSSSATKVAFSFPVLPGAKTASPTTIATAHVTLTP